MVIPPLPFDPNWGLFLATVVLVGVTFFYAIETRRLVRAPYRPSLRPSFAHDLTQNTDNIILHLKIKNIGVGIATDIEVKYSIEADSTTAGNIRIETIELLYPPDKSDSVKRSELSLDINGLQPITPTTTQTQEGYIIHNTTLS